MSNSQTYFEANRKNWNERAEIHARSRAYNLDAFRNDPEHLSGVVSFDQTYLGDIQGAQVVHLQCHIGTDTLSLARLGAEVTGLDLSETSLETARRLFADTGTPGTFKLGNVYDAPQILGKRYDLVYTGVGALNWLPSIKEWARVVYDLLLPGGRIYLREGHPMLLALADTTDGSLRLEYPYFETSEPMIFDEPHTYTGDPDTVENIRLYEWNHGLGQVVGALLEAGLTLRLLNEHDGLEWQMFPHMKLEGGLYKLPPEQRDLVPMMYSLLAEKVA